MGQGRAVLIVAYNGADYLPDCLNSLRDASSVSGDQLHFETIVVDNASSDQTMTVVASDFPECHWHRSDWHRSDLNLGFAGGNNLAWEVAQRLENSSRIDWDYLYLLNQDTIVHSNFLIRALDYAERNPLVGAVQSLLLLHPQTDQINTAGNTLHFLGFGLPTAYHEPIEHCPASGEIAYPSGAAVLVNADLVRRHGLFADYLFMYLEDAQLGWRLHLLGRPVHVCVASRVEHKYQFASTLRSYEHLERNRWWLLLVHYQIWTLFLLMPALVVMEAGQLVFAFQNGVLRGKGRAWKGMLHRDFLTSVVKTRRSTQRHRVVSDRQMMTLFSGTIDSPHLTSWIIRGVANPGLSLYRRMVLRLVR